MKSIFAGIVCRVLIASMLVLPWQAQAGMIGTDQAVAAARGTLTAVIDREEVAGQLQLLGLSPQAARERVAALSNAEVADLAGRIDALPAGGNSLLAFIVACVLFYFLVYVPQTTAKAEPATGKGKPAPVPEKK